MFYVRQRRGGIFCGKEGLRQEIVISPVFIVSVDSGITGE